MKRYKLLSIVASIVAVPTLTFAQPPEGGFGGRGPDGPGGFGGPGGPPPGGSPIMMLMEKFSEIDADNDGQITKDELKVAMGNEQQNPQRRPGGPALRRDEEGRGGPGGPGERGGFGGPGGRGEPGGEPPRHGQVLPDRVVADLQFTEDQRSKLQTLQATVDKQLAAILTDEQKQRMEEHRQQRGQRGEGDFQRGGARERGGADSGRPQRPR